MSEHTHPDSDTNPSASGDVPEFDSIFDGEPEMPAPGAIHHDESGEDPSAPTVTAADDGHLKASVPLGDVNPYDHSAEQDAIEEKRKKDGTAPPPMPEDDFTPLQNPNMMLNPTDQLMDEMERRFQLELGDSKVKVTATDRDAFVRSAMLDQEMVFVIEIEGINATVKVAMAPDEFTNSAAAAVTQWGKDGFIDSDSQLQWLLAFQQMHVWYQVREINGEPTSWSDYWADGMPSIRDMRAQMRNHASFEPFFKMNAVRWRMLLDAVRTAELKYKICLQNWKNRSFFTGADTD